MRTVSGLATLRTAVRRAEVPTRPDDRIYGVHCAHSHFNDPAVPYCASCGVAMAQTTRQPVLGVRPQLGVLTLDDGSMYRLTMDHVLGRAPQLDPAVRSGAASPVRLSDPAVAPVHARLVLDGWDVVLVDAGPDSGTLVLPPGQRGWTPLPAGARLPLRPGTAMALGRHVLQYHSHRHHR